MVKHFPNINLIGFRVSLKKIANQKKLRVTRWSLYALVGFLVLFIPILIFRFVFSAQKNRLTTDIETLSQEIASLKAVEAKYALLHSKSNALIGLNSERVILEPKILEVYEVMPDGTIIDDVSFGEGGRFLNVVVNASDVFAVGDLMESLTNAVGTKFSSITIDSTKRNVEGVYKVTMELYFES